MMAATMLGQGKTVHQAEIDCMAETIDFLRFNPKYAEEIYSQQPPKNSRQVWNRMEYRPLEGYVVAITPFNFTAIGANLPTSPALMGNVVLWKPASTAIRSNYVMYQVLVAAGMPPGVIQFVPGSGRVIGDILINDRNFAGLHFTGSTEVFNSIMFNTASNLHRNLYRSYPRIVGETGGKDFHFIHESADLDHAVFSTVRGAFEYSGQKCSACSRAYVSDAVWPQFKAKMLDILAQAKVGQCDDFSCFSSAVIDELSFDRIMGYIEEAKRSDKCKIIAGGNGDKSKGFMIDLTVIETSDPHFKTMEEEIFGPVLTVYVYPHDKLEESLQILDETSPYALTGAVFAKDRYTIDLLTNRLRNSAGNFYVNDKCTGAVVGQQPFGGARASGTNDKAGAHLNLLRWTSCRSIKETFVPITTWKYPHME
jgi:1-pyrroline-5-carboxylate dehydrogenase